MKEINQLVRLKQNAKNKGNVKALEKYINELADIYFQAGKFKDALQEYTEQLEICEILDDRLNCHRMIGEVNMKLGNFEDASFHLHACLNGARELKDVVQEQRAQTTLGTMYYSKYEIEMSKTEKECALKKARAAYSKSIDLCDKVNKSNRKLSKMEIPTMRVRALINYSLVLDGKREMECLEEARKMCLEYNLRDDLHRVYNALASMYEKKNDDLMAKEYFDLAADINDWALKSNAIVLKSELMLKLGEFPEAEVILWKLYKVKEIPVNIRENMERLLKLAVFINTNEKKLKTETREREKLVLYEKLGDAAAAVRCFTKAVEYYKQMLRCAERTWSERIPAALVSLYETLQDMGKYAEALMYARRELTLAKTFSDSSKSALVIAGLLREIEAPDAEIREAFDMALENARKSLKPSLERDVLENMIAYFNEKCQKKEAKLAQENLLSLKIESDSEDEDKSDIQDIGMDVCLDDLMNFEDGEKAKKRQPQQKAPGFKMKINEKGETPLQTACISGKIEKVEELIEARHSVNVRDNAGWTPLHEAANYGYVEIAELLIKAGANVNDPGGKDCGGVTPFHDAAINGHFSIMNLLMKNGANLNLLQDDGSSVLDCLMNWRDKNTDVTVAEEIEFNSIYKRLKELIRVESKCEKSKEKAVRPRTFKNVISDDESDVEEEEAKQKTEREEKISASELYKRAIENLKRRSDPLSKGSGNSKVKAPLIDSEDALIDGMDDWMEDDLGINKMKSSPMPPDPFYRNANVNMNVKRKSNDSLSSSEKNSKRQRCEDKSPMNFGDIYDLDSSSVDSVDSVDSPVRPSSKTRKKRRQTALTDIGFEKEVIPRVPSLVELPMDTLTIRNTGKTKTARLKIWLQDKFYDVQVLLAEDWKIMEKSILEQLEQKYRNEMGVNAELALAVSDVENALNNLRANGAGNEFKAEILNVTIPSLRERYKIFCGACRIPVEEAALDSLSCCESSSRFALNSDETTKEELPLLLKSLKYQESLHSLNLSGTELFFHGKLLDASLSEHASLLELNLQECDIGHDCLSKIKLLPPGLRVLNLSYNPLGTKSREKLDSLLEPLQELQTLNLCSCDLLDFQFDKISESISNLNLSMNAFDRVEIQNLGQRHFVELNLSFTMRSFSDSSAVLGIAKDSRILSFALESLDLSCTGLGDSDLNLILLHTPNLRRLRINNNENITHVGLNALLNFQPTMMDISAYGCTEISEPPDSGTFIAKPEVCTLLVSMESSIVHMWENLWRGTCHGNILRKNLVKFQPR